MAQAETAYLMKILDSLTDEIVILDEKSNIISANRAWTDFAPDSGKNYERIGTNTNYLNVCNTAQGDFSQGASAVALGITSIINGDQSLFVHEYECPDEHGYIQWYEMKVTRLANHEPLQLVVTHSLITQRKEYEFELSRNRDHLEEKVILRTEELEKTIQKLEDEITKRRITEETLRESRKQISNFSRQLTSSIEKERTDIAREIHDELGQTLTALKLDITWLQRHVDSNEVISERFATAVTLLENTILVVKDILSKLRPSLLKDLGLCPALQFLAKLILRRAEIEYDIDCDLAGLQLNEDDAIMIYRIVQEALTNVAKHSNAHSVRVFVHVDQTQLKLSINDDGPGCENFGSSPDKGFGIVGIKERAAYLGGQAELSSGKGLGTTLKANFPLKRLVRK